MQQIAGLRATLAGARPLHTPHLQSSIRSRSIRSVARRPAAFRVAASAEAAKFMTDARAKFDANDRMGALNLWEATLKANPDDAQRMAALYNATVVHAGFGDVELAQITLREAVQRGLNFTAAVIDPVAADPNYVKLVASQQVLVRLRKFDEATRKAMGAAAAPPPRSASSSSRSPTTRSLMERDLSQVLETDMQGIDTSIMGIVRRVALLLVVLSAAGVGMYLVGIKYLFPEDF